MRKLIGLSLVFALAAPLIAVDRAPVVCVMGGTATIGEVVRVLHHHMPHGTSMSRGKNSRPDTHHGSRNCICPWECGSTRGPADPVQHAWNLAVTADRTASPFLFYANPVAAIDTLLPLTTGPPASLRS